MKKFEINKSKLYALLLAGGITTSFTGCNQENQNNEKEPINSDNTEIVEIEDTTQTTITTVESIESATVTSEGKVELEAVSGTSVPTERINIDGDNAHNVYVESANEVNIFYGVDENDANLVTENVKSTETTNVTPVQTTVAPVQTTAQTTVAPVQTTAQTTVVTTIQETNKEIDLVRFEELTDALSKELNAHKIVKSAGKKFTKADLYSTVYIYNIDFIDEDLKRQLVEKDYIADDIATILVDAASVRDAVSTYNQNLLLYNTNIDELMFALNYFKDDSSVYSELTDEEGVYRTIDYNSFNRVSTRAIEKLKEVDIDTYFTARDKYYNNHDSINVKFAKYASACDEKPKKFEGISSFEMADFADISVAVNDSEAKNNVYNSLKLSVDASLNNDQAYDVINNYYNFCIANKTATTLTDCGAGASFAINTNILSYTRFIGYNEYKTMQGFAKDEHEYKQIRVKYKTIDEVIQELNDVVKIYESCSKQLTK